MTNEQIANALQAVLKDVDNLYGDSRFYALRAAVKALEAGLRGND